MIQTVGGGSGGGRDILVIITHFASRARAMIPAASGAEADVPVCESVHFDLRSVVTCVRKQTERMNKSASPRTKAARKCSFFPSGYSFSFSVQQGEKTKLRPKVKKNSQLGAAH